MIKKYSLAVSKSLNKRFKSPLLAKFLKAIDEYKLIEEGDKICVAMSGGKDSLLLAALFEEYKIHFNHHIDVVYLMMSSGFTDKFLENYKENCDYIGIESEIADSNIFEIANHMNPKSPCFLCARMRRGFLYQKAKDLGCNKLALGHHFDDVIETTLMNMFYTGTFKTMLPKARAKNYEGIELIRPMYLIKEKEVQRFMSYHHLEFASKGCAFQDRDEETKRSEMKRFIQQLRETYENIDINIFRSAENINLDAVLGYFDDTGRKSFMDDY